MLQVQVLQVQMLQVQMLQVSKQSSISLERERALHNGADIGTDATTCHDCLSAQYSLAILRDADGHDRADFEQVGLDLASADEIADRETPILAPDLEKSPVSLRWMSHLFDVSCCLYLVLSVGIDRSVCHRYLN